MKNASRPVVALLVLLAIASQVMAHWDRTGLIINVPTAQMLPSGVLAASVNGSMRNWYDTPMQYDGFEAGAAVRFAPIERLEVAVTAYTLKDYVLGASYRLLGEPGQAGLAVGVHDIGLNKYVSPVGNGLDDAWPDWKYGVACPPYSRPMENFSAYAVGTMPVADFLRFTVGLGRGRYVGYSRGLNINTDIFFDETNQWAVGLLGGVEVDVGQHVTLAAEFDGRDVNAGVNLTFGPIGVGLAMTKLEGLTGREGYEFGRFNASISYQSPSLYRKPAPEPEPIPEPIPEPEPEPEPEPIVVELKPIYFDLDKSFIRPGDAKILQENADAIQVLIDDGQEPQVMVEGHCCPLATNAYNMALGWRRAESAKRYLVELGVDPDMLTTISYGEERIVEPDPERYYMNRRCEFVLEENE